MIVSDEILAEHAYLVERGVRPLAVAGHVFVEETDLLLVASRVERYGAMTGLIPWTLDHFDGTGSYGYASEQWALDLYEWVVKTAPEEQRERIIGLLLGYAPRAVASFDANATGRRFSTSSPGPASSSRDDDSASTAETPSRPRAGSPSRDSRCDRSRMSCRSALYVAFASLLIGPWKRRAYTDAPKAAA